MPITTGAKVVANFLKENKISHVFDVAGGMIAYLEDEISKLSGIKCSPNHHEQCCGFAAEGYARMGRNFGVAIATSGPGATNLITAIGSCFFDSVPAMFITGQVNTNDLKKHKNIRQNGFQETDIVSVVKSLTKYAKFVIRSEDVLYELEKAYFIMKDGRPGPVLLDIPIDVQRIEIDVKKLKHFFGSPEHKKMLLKKRPTNISEKVEKLEIMLKRAKAPVVIVGGGIRTSRTQNELHKFVKSNNLPVVCSLMGLDSFSGVDSNFVGFIGSYGNREANIVLANADLIISLGSRLDLRQTGNPKQFATKAAVVHVDVDPYSINNNVKSRLFFQMDLKDFFHSVKMLKTSAKLPWVRFIKKVKNNFSKIHLANKKNNPSLFISRLSDYCGKDCNIVSDVGNHQMWVAQSWRVKPGQRLLFSGGMGSMGFALPAAIGAHFADADRTTVVVCGDGGFQMNIQELQTVRRNKIPLKIFLLNNSSLGMVKDFQTFYFNKNYQSTVVGYSNPDFKKIASAYGIDYLAVNHGLQKIDFKRILSSNKAILVEIKIALHTPLEPKVIFGKPLDDQYPFLDKKMRQKLDNLKRELQHGK